MIARDANNATWYVLRYPEDYTRPRTAGSAGPRLDAGLLYDEARGVLELAPRPGADAQPLRGVAIALTGETYRVDRVDGRSGGRPVIAIECAGSVRVLALEPNVLASPAGLALARRDRLLVADPAARRVVVVCARTGRLHMVLVGPFLHEPVDVAVSVCGRVYVADRGSGRIEVFDHDYAHRFGFAARNAAGLPESPRPIAVTTMSDGSVVVADAQHPRLLRFTPRGRPLADLELGALEADGAEELPMHAVGARLAALHRADRVRGLALARRFARRGTFVSRAFDSGSPLTTWHRIAIEAELPESTALTIETQTAETVDAFRDATAAWSAPANGSGQPIAFTAEQPEQLIQSPPGRYLWLRITLSSATGTKTPRLHAVRVYHPRNSYVDSLPRTFRRDPAAALFLERFLALFERTFTAIEDRYDELSRELNPDAAPRDVIDWLACLVDLAFDPSWSMDKRRTLVASAMELYERRGTPDGLARFIEIYTGRTPAIVEGFLHRPMRAGFVGRRGAIVGCMPISSGVTAAMPRQGLFSAFAHRFSVWAYVSDDCDASVAGPVIERIIEVNKPAHTRHQLQLVYPDARLGLHSTIGLDFVLGYGPAPGITLRNDSRPPLPRTGRAVLGVATLID